MKDFKTKVAVIGSGIAGFMAAKQVAREGDDVAVFSRSYGATAMSTGVMDIANPTVVRVPLDAPEELVSKKYARNPNHPYALVLRREKERATHNVGSSENGHSETVGKAIHDLTRSLNDVHYPMEGSLEHNMLLIDSIGSAKCTCLAPPSIAQGDLTRIMKGKILFVGFKGHPDYDPRLCSHNFTTTQRVVGLRDELGNAGSEILEFPHFEGRSTLLSIELAREIDRGEGVATKIGQMVGDSIKGNGVTHVCLPPCMGVDKVIENMKIIGDESGLIPFECATLTPPSILGFRLQLALDESASRLEIPVMMPYEATAFHAEGKTLKRMTVISGERSFQVEAEGFILATGSFIGGGIIEKDETVKEPLLDLPLFDENGAEVNDAFIRGMLSDEAVPVKGHPVFSVGIKVNENMQPISSTGELVYDNLFACGNILSGFSHTSSGCRYGVAITTAYVAGEEASRRQLNTG